MKLYRAKTGFYDQEWDGDGRLVNHFVPKGVVIAIDRSEPEPRLEFWEFIFEFEPPQAAKHRRREVVAVK